MTVERARDRPAAAASANGPLSPSGGPERVITFRLRSVLSVIGLIIAVAATVGLVVIAQHALVLIALSLFAALALDPPVVWLQRRGMSRGWAIAAVFVAAILFVALLGIAFIPPLVKEVTKFINGLPDLVRDVTKGQGPLGFLESKYHVVEQVRKLTSGGKTPDVSGAADPLFSFVSGVLGTVVGVLVVAFLALFMLVEGPDWRRRGLELFAPRHRGRAERIAHGMYKAVGSFVTGNLLASLVAGVFVLVLMLIAGLPYPFPIALLVTLVELVPYLGPAVTTVILGALGLTQGVLTAVIVVGVLLVYHFIEGHSLRPWIYGRALQLSPLVVLIAFLVGIEIAGVIGALVAIPVAGVIQVVLEEVRLSRQGDASESSTPA